MQAIESKVINPIPLPVRPNICCSMGAELVSTTAMYWTTNRLIITIKKFEILLFVIVLFFFKTIGVKYRATKKRIITFGIINASLFHIGVPTNVTATALDNIREKIDLFLLVAMELSY
jgi:hypothetical protein